ncbi:hypothetical protein G6F44_002753 [Rhizopus delemar]|nr:hypothetical protein G6F44_002753 [Rhizopus delemar]
MSNWQHLPQEVLEQALQGLPCASIDSAAFIQCLHVFKHWNSVATCLLYKSIWIIDKVKRTELIDCLTISQLGHLVQNLCLHIDYSEAEDARFIKAIAELCPNLKVLSCYMLAEGALWDDLAHLSRKHFKNLQALPRPTQRTMPNYYRCALCYKDTLRTFYIREEHPLSDQRESITLQLQDFRHLSQLIIYNEAGTTSPMDYDDMLNRCSQLQTLNLEIAECDNDTYISQSDMSSVIIPHFSINNLNITFNFDVFAFKYFICKFPNLSYLRVSINCPATSAIREQQELYFSRYFLALLNYFSSITHHDVNFYGRVDVLPDIIPFTKKKCLTICIDHHQTDFQYPKIGFTNKEVCLFYRRCSRAQLLDLWNKASHIIRNLTFSVHDGYRHNDDYDGDDYKHELLVNIFSHCTSIETFRYQCSEYLCVPPERWPVHNTSLKSLCLVLDRIDEVLFPVYSHSFKSLENLTIDADFGPSDIYKVHMLYTRLNSLGFIFTTHEGQDMDTLIVKIKTNSSKYKTYKANGDCLEECNDTIARTMFVLEIFCYSIEQLSLSMNTIELNNYPLHL